MGLNVGNLPVNQVYVGSVPVLGVYVGSQKIWPTIVQITLGPEYEAQFQFRDALAGYGLDYETVEEIPFGIELVGTGSARDMFARCSALTAVPEMDTSQVTNMSGMFWQCESLTHVPDMDTSQVVDMSDMFQHCSSLTYVPDMDTSLVTDVGSMFEGCTVLTDGNVRLIGKLLGVYTTGMIVDSGLTREPFYDTDGKPWQDIVQITLGSEWEAQFQLRDALAGYGLDYETVEEIPFEIELVGTGSAREMFARCSALTAVPEMDTSQVTNMSGMFWQCSSLTYVPDMDTAQVVDMSDMFEGCTVLTDGNVRLIGKHPQVDTSGMIVDSGLTREPFYDTDG